MSRKRQHETSMAIDNHYYSSSFMVTQSSSQQLLSSSSPSLSLEYLKVIESPNFEELCRCFPSFQTQYRNIQQQQQQQQNHGNNNNNKKKNKSLVLHFSSAVTPEFNYLLTKSILQYYFQLSLQIIDTSKYLCPPVPNRFYYLCWIHETLLLLLSSQLHNNVNNNIDKKTIVGLDIGVGASCIYPLLAAKYFQTKMLGTEIDPFALQQALQNVQQNQLQSMIYLYQVTNHNATNDNNNNNNNNHPNKEILFGPLQQAIHAMNMTSKSTTMLSSLFDNDDNNNNTTTSTVPHFIDFIMTNPPFYSNTTEQSKNRIGDGRSRTPMTNTEGTYNQGGEVGFVMDIFMDSLILLLKQQQQQQPKQDHFATIPSRYCWYSSMFGKKSSFLYIQKLLQYVLGPAHVWCTEYGPGQYTRWFIAWNFHPRPNYNSTFAKLPIHPTLDQFEIININETTIKTQENNDNIDIADNTMVESNGNIISNDDDNNNNMTTMHDSIQEIVNRIHDYCDLLSQQQQQQQQQQPFQFTCHVREAQSTKCIVQITEHDPKPISLFVNEYVTRNKMELPLQLQTILQQLQQVQSVPIATTWLPIQGHFVMDITISTSLKRDDFVSVKVLCYRHSLHGQHMIDLFRNGLKDEISRTNRKWRRRLKRQQNQNKASISTTTTTTTTTNMDTEE